MGRMHKCNDRSKFSTASSATTFCKFSIFFGLMNEILLGFRSSCFIEKFNILQVCLSSLISFHGFDLSFNMLIHFGVGTFIATGTDASVPNLIR